ncbi:MAG: 30S ribosomal protein S12 methylthiotransferase RimO [Anaerolineales bacterium]|jgi:ribosomal protein S12 methylthiotransferase
MVKNKRSFYMLSLGCAKNTVDSNSMAQLLARSGFHAVPSPEDAGFLVVNTCGFIGPAKEESYQALQALAQDKRPGQMLIAAGCLTQRYGAQVVERVPGIDAVLGTRRWMDIVDVVQTLRQDGGPEPMYHLPDSPTVGADVGGIHQVARQGGSAYLKIADGCRRPCAFCAIPLIKGTAVSRPVELILDEARMLNDAGVRELVLIAQDTTDYGSDLGIKNGMAPLLKKLLAAAPDIDWFRILYAFPGYVTGELIDVMADAPRVLPYLDIPLQHAHPEVLRRMRRPANMEWIYRTLETMRNKMPGLAVRTTFIVGYPGETESEFRVLLDFVERMRFDRVGAFLFSFEAGTESAALGDPVPADVKEERYQRLMELQQSISLQKNQEFVGRTLDVIVEGYGDGISVGRSYRDAPEIDGLVLVEGELPVGEIAPVIINGAMVYDLSGIPAGVASIAEISLDRNNLDKTRSGGV